MIQAPSTNANFEKEKGKRSCVFSDSLPLLPRMGIERLDSGSELEEWVGPEGWRRPHGLDKLNLRWFALCDENYENHHGA